MTTALITGASTGLGKEFARLFASDGIDVVITSSPRSADALEALADDLRTRYSVKVTTTSLDLSADGAAHKLFYTVQSHGIDIDWLVNNAGYGIVGAKLQDYAPEQFSGMIRLNVLALAELTMLYVPQMVARGSGRILNVSSIAGYIVPHGLEAGYSATKAFVVSLSEGLSADLAGTGVTCTHLAPGPTRTQFFGTAGLADDRRLNRIYMDAAEVAAQGYSAMLAGKSTVMPGLGNKAMKFGARLSPSKKLTAALSGYFVHRGGS